MVINCPSCGANIPNDFRYCGFCGESIEAYQKRYSSEIQQIKDRSSRRVVTVLFADLVNFTSAAEGVDPEIVYRTIRNTLEYLSLIIRRLGGCVDRYYGDGFLATFGIPEAHEDDHFRALQAALEMQISMQELGDKAKQTLNWDMQLRIGINVGPVIRGQLDTGFLQDSSIFGHTVNLASRLQAAARPSSTLVDESVYLKTSTKYSFLDPVELQLKGIDKPVFAYELIEQISDPKPSRGILGRAVYFIGRDFEKEFLVKRLERLHTDRQGTITLITGEAGIGKSRLVEEALPLHSKSVTIVRNQGSPFTSSNYAFVLDIVAGLEAIQPKLSVPSPKKIDDLRILTPDEPIRTDPQENLLRIITLTRSLVTKIAKRQPLIILFDDIQWADSSSLEVISHIVDLTNELPLSLIFVARSTFFEHLPDYLKSTDYRDSHHFYNIKLQSLSSHESHRLIDKLVPELLVPSSIKDELYERSGGNPLFIEELVNALRDEVTLRENEGDWALDKKWKELIKDIPSTVNGLLLNRYDRQSPEMKYILDMASVIGQRFHASLLATICDISEADIIAKIDHLEQADLLRRSTGFSSPIYSFRHALMQEAIYDTILYEDRILLHEKVSETLKNVADEYYINADAVIGHHLELCGSFEAIDYLIKAATRSTNHYANSEAITYFNRAQKLLEKVEKDQPQIIDVALGLSVVLNRKGESDFAKNQLIHALEESNSSTLSNYRIGDIHYQLGLTLFDLGEIKKSRKNFESALQILETSPADCRLFSKTDIEREIGWVFWQKGKIEKSFTHANKALSIAQKDGNTVAEGSARKLLASIYYWNGQIQQSIENAEKSLKIRELAGDIWKAASSQTTLGHLYHQIGQWKLAEKMLRQAIYVQKEIGDYYLLASSWSNLGLILLDKGKTDEALDCMNESVKIVFWQNLPLSMATPFFINRGIVLLRIGNLESAHADFEHFLKVEENQSNNDLRALGLAYMAEVKTKSREINCAHTYMEKAQKFVEHTESNEIMREILRIKSYLQRVTENYDAAIISNNEAQIRAKEEGNRYEYGRLVIDKAKIFFAKEDVADILNPELQFEIENTLRLFQEFDSKTGISWAEEILYKIASHKLSNGGISKESSEYPTVVINIKLKSPTYHSLQEEPFEKAVKINQLIAKELSKIVSKPNIFLNTSPNGFTIIISTIDHKILKDKQTAEAIEYALTSLSAIVRVNKIGRNKYGYYVIPTIGISIGTSQELVLNQEQAAVFSNISQLGRFAQVLSESAPDFQILFTGDIPRVVRESYQLEDIHISTDLPLNLPCYFLGEAVSQKSLSSFLPKSTDQLIGRDEELSSLKIHLDQMISQSCGQIIYIEAEAGVGKSRMLREIRNFSESNILFLHGKCEASRKSISFWPLIQILSKDNVVDSVNGNRVKSLLGLFPPDEKDKYLLHNLPTDSRREEFYSRTSEYLKALASHGPIMVVLEDIHDIDLSTLDILDFLVPIIYEAQISILLIARSEMPGPHRSLVNKAKRICHDRFHQITLGALSVEQSKQLIKELLDSTMFPDRILDVIEPFIGHPLSLEEIVRYLVEGGVIWKFNDTWEMVDNSEILDREMPSNFRDLLLKRLAFLDHESLHILQTCALLGESFDQIVLSRMITDSSLVQKLSELSDKGWLQKPTNGNPLSFMFNHTLTQETIYSTLVRSKKQLLHQRAGEAIESLYPESIEENVEVLAYHFEKGGMPDKSLHYQIRAAEKCTQNHALHESRGYFQKAKSTLIQRNQVQSRMMIRVTLGLVDISISLGESTRALELIDHLLESNQNLSNAIHAAFFRRLGDAYHLRGDLQAALENYHHALEKINSVQEYQLNLGRDLLVSKYEERLDIQIGLSKVRFDSGEYQKAEEVAQIILKEVSGKQQHERVATLYNTLAGIAFRKTDFQLAQLLTKKSLARYQANNNRSRASSMYSNLGVIASIQQDFNIGHEYFSTALEIQNALGDKKGIAISTNNLGQLELNLGNLTKAKGVLRTSIETARRSELLHSLAQGLSNIGYVYFLNGEYDDAYRYYDEAKTFCNSFQYLDLLSEIYWKQAECFLAIGKITNARNAADSAIELAREIENPDLEIHGLRSVSRVLRYNGDTITALKLLKKGWKRIQDDRDTNKVTRFASEYALCLTANDLNSKAVDIVQGYLINRLILEPRYIRKELINIFPFEYKFPC